MHIDTDKLRERLLKPIMFVGTCSDAGKSIINTAFCRIFKQDGYSPAPFKAQNMSLNSYSTFEGGEMGRAQVVQAEACGILPHTDMNPILLKPTNDLSSQVILNGIPVGNMSAKDYFSMKEQKMKLFNKAQEAFNRLSSKYNPIVLEGAGSISELNLKERDITNMRMAAAADAATFLVADIDRGGVFASVYGSIALLNETERNLIKGIIINKFRGDETLFEEGKQIIQNLTGIPVVAVIPWFKDIKIEEEDSVVLDSKNNEPANNRINVAVLRLNHISNFTDFNAFELDSRYNLYYTNLPEKLKQADIIILPGTKNTIADLNYLKKSGLADTLCECKQMNKKIIGICGGYQMMGKRIEDPLLIEGNIKETEGLGFLPIQTTLVEKKITRQSSFCFIHANQSLCKGYEIHMGRTSVLNNMTDSPVVITNQGIKDGYFLNDSCWGCYMHGIFDNAAVLDYLSLGFDVLGDKGFDYDSFKQEQYNKLAALVRKHTDMEYIYSCLTHQN